MKDQGGPKSISDSSKARSWTSDSTGLEGLFAQHAQQPAPPSAPPISQLGQSEDSFGDFQTGPTGRGGQPNQPAREEGRVTENFKPPNEAKPAQESISSQFQENARNILSRKVPHGPVSFTTGSQHPVLSTSISGLTNKGYISSDVILSHSHGVFTGKGEGDGAEGHPSPPPAPRSAHRL